MEVGDGAVGSASPLALRGRVDIAIVIVVLPFLLVQFKVILTVDDFKN